jgi:signal peptidase II
MRHPGLFLAVAFLGAFLDLLTKHLVFDYFEAGPGRNLYPREVVLVEGWFSYGCTRNPGVIFGMGQNARWVWYAISILAVPAILAIFFSVKRPKWILTASLGMILAGTLGNMYDRVFTKEHAVRDFLKVFYVGADRLEHVWPLFNLADSFICVGVFLLTVEMLFFDEKKKPARKEADAPVPASAVEGK